MEKGQFMLFCMLGLAVALTLFFPLGAKRRSLIPPFAWWLCLLLGGITCMYSLSHSTAPSFAPRITAVGKAYDCVERGKGNKFGFHFLLEDAEQVHIETHITMPGWANPAHFDGRTLRVIYLKDDKRNPSNEAIDIAILSGDRAGFHDSLDARPFGVWLGIPIGAALSVFGFFGIRSRKDDIDSAASAEDAS